MVKISRFKKKGSVGADGRIKKSPTEHDQKRLDIAINQAREVMEGAGVFKPFEWVLKMEGIWVVLCLFEKKMWLR